MMTRQRVRLTILLALGALCCHGQQNAYDPLHVPTDAIGLPVDLTVTDSARRRDIPIRVYLPGPKEPAPVILFSHGLGGSRKGCTYLGQHWSARGYVAVFLQHPGSDASVWKDVPWRNRLAAMDAAANGRSFMLRVRDVPTVIDQLAVWNTTEGHDLEARTDLEAIGMSGHSFGARTTQAVSGETYRGRAVLTDPRIGAAVALSPSAPRRGTAEAAFGAVRIPWLLMTGTRDVARVGTATLDSRLAVFPALPAGSKYELVLYDAQHSAFSGRALPGDDGPRNPNHHRAILALSTAFWDAYLRNDPEARAWLDGPGPATVLKHRDRWQRK